MGSPNSSRSHRVSTVIDCNSVAHSLRSLPHGERTSYLEAAIVAALGAGEQNVRDVAQYIKMMKDEGLKELISPGEAYAVFSGSQDPYEIMGEHRKNANN